LEAGKHDSIKILFHTFWNDCGLCQVQHDFEDMMTQIVGESVFDDFYRNHRSEYLEFVHDLRQKMILQTKDEKPVNIQIPVSLTTAFERTTGNSLNQAVQETKFANKMSFLGSTCKCRIMPEIFQSLFSEVGTNVVQLVNQAIKDSELSNIVNIMLVGFLSKSAIFQDIIRKSFPTHHVIIPDDGNLVVVKGAAIYGQKPVIVYKVN
jgi:molecular chaperone DnaK (HSP70)